MTRLINNLDPMNLVWLSLAFAILMGHVAEVLP
ncbi:hypothetical protein GGQ99_001335 [Aminobacter niigataensis]|uniref:Uncharacterized protein n=1 Tax=Aminobacter niigataensis TaxID=83265 RepID=A0ABR6KYJ7_9HYPH|nr:hypothetical protein [Aminobacter niigataensis]